MAVYARKDSPAWWMHLEGTSIRTSTKIPRGEKHAHKDSKGQAEEIYRAAMGDLARGTFKIPTAKAARTFRQQVDWYREHVTAQHRGAKRERSTLTNLLDHFEDLPLTAITTAAIETWKLQRAKAVKQSTVNRELEVLKPLFGSAVPLYLESNPAAAVKKFRLRFPQIAILSEDAEDKLLKAATPAERAFLLLGLDALLRSGDARRLKAEHDHGTHLDLVDPKTEAYKVPVSRRLRAALDVLRPVEGFYFPRKYAGAWHAMNSVTAFALFRGVCERAGVPTGRAGGGITFHGLRHTGATRAARSVKLTVVQRLGGWKSLTQLARYDHPDDPEIIRAVEAIGSRVAHAPIRAVKKARQTG